MNDDWLSPELAREARRLYTYCFEEEPAFTDWFFADRFRPENTLAAVENGRLLSTVQMIPYRMRVRGSVVPVAYIVGVATWPDARGRGHAGRLLRLSLAKAKERGLPLLPLYPFDYDFYRRYGWETANDIARIDVPLSALSFSSTGVHVEMASPLDRPADFAEAADAALAGLSGPIARDDADWLSRARQMEAERGFAALAFRDGAPSGAALYRLHDRIVDTDEFYAADPLTARALLSFLGAHSSTADSAKLSVPVCTTAGTPPLWQLLATPALKVSIEPHVMLRVADAPAALNLALAAAPSSVPPVALEVTDRDAPWNTGVYLLGDGRAVRADLPAELSVTERGLAMLISGYGSASLAAARGLLSGPAGAVAAPDAPLPPVPAFTLEEW